MSSSRPETLRRALVLAGTPTESYLSDGVRTIPLREALETSRLGGTRDSLAGRSVLLAVDTQFEAALALIELDGLARRIVLLPPDVKSQQLPAIVRDAEIDAIVCTAPEAFEALGPETVVFQVDVAVPVMPPDTSLATEWLMLTSGTTGDPKLAIHTLGGLTGAIPLLPDAVSRPRWATFYDIRRYGGLQIFLRAMFCGGNLVLSRPGEPVADHLERLSQADVTHVSGTPSHWRRVMMTKAAIGFNPSYVRLSGEIADQPILDGLRAAFPAASIGHAYASTEAGVGFDVNDGLEGFPASYLDAPRNGVEMRIQDGCLQIRSGRMASAYAGRPDLPLVGADGWVDTGDMVEVIDGRCHFRGRRSGVINVGGLKVHPEEIETVINRHAAVRQAKVKPRKSPIIGNIVVADVVLADGTHDADQVKRNIIELCAASLPTHKVPALVNIVSSIEMTAGGKVSRQHA
ncbi:long-chain fatty acid--CoA ligase [Aestuariivirga sp.]|uniref:ANL family adenylate-forming protein n=1 Tax=Aestuariivirga sp. TaxID=2650926 RepID=UPI003594553B